MLLNIPVNIYGHVGMAYGHVGMAYGHVGMAASDILWNFYPPLRCKISARQVRSDIPLILDMLRPSKQLTGTQVLRVSMGFTD